MFTRFRTDTCRIVQNVLDIEQVHVEWNSVY